MRLNSIVVLGSVQEVKLGNTSETREVYILTSTRCENVYTRKEVQREQRDGRIGTNHMSHNETKIMSNNSTRAR